MPSHLIHLSTEEAAALIGLSAFKDRRGETVIRLLLPGCGSMKHDACQVLIPRIGTEDSPRKWIGWYHCSCPCHDWTEMADGWSVKPAKNS